MNWEQTRDRLIELGMPEGKLPKEHALNMDLRGADLSDAMVNWASHDIVAEILRRHAKDDIAKRKVAGLILISHDWCWADFVKLHDPLQAWAFSVLADYVQDGDNAPKLLARYANIKAAASDD